MASIISRDHAHPNGAAQAHAAEEDREKARALVSGLVQEDAAKGAATHAFDPDASPEEKAASAGRAKAQLEALPGYKRNKEKEGGRAVAIDTGSAGGATPETTVTLADVDKASKAEGQGVGDDSIPGSIPAGAAPAVPTWMQTGWRQVAGLDAAAAADTKLQEHLGILADYLDEQMYGAWYHNAGIILFAILITRFITVLHFGWGWILVLLAACSAYYSLSISRTRHRARDDIQRELVKTRLVTETESADWLNQFLDRFWLIYEPVLSQTIVASVDAVLAANTPSFLESIRLTTFTLGTKAPRIDYVRTFPKTPEDIVIMDWALSFTPNDLMDITPRQAQKRVNPKIVLAIRVGKGGISKRLPILLEDMSFSGKMRIKLKLMTNFPHVQTIDMSFIEKPTFDYVLKPLGGDTFGFDINHIPGLAPFIREQVHANLGPMMYDPNVFTIDLQALLSGTPLDAAIGVLKVTISNARGVRSIKLGGGDPDPYVTIALGAKPAVAKTKTVRSTSSPTWNETQFILINSLSDVLNLSLWDYNEHRPDNLLGSVTFELTALGDDAEREGLTGKIIAGGKERGELRYDLSYFPVLQAAKNPDGTIEPLPDTQTGIVRFTIHQAKDLDATHAFGALNPYARIYLGGNATPAHKTPVIKHSNAPIWEDHFEFLVAEKHNSVVTIRVTDSKDFAGDPDLGHLSIALDTLLSAKARQQDWFPLGGSTNAKVRLTTEWKPVAMAGSMSGSASYVPPIGILRIWLKKAIDVKNVEGMTGGKSDPYVRVMLGGKIMARTDIINNNLNPEWDQIVYVPVHNLRENVVLEVMDYQNVTKDRSLGYVELKVADRAVADEGNVAYPYKSTGPKAFEDHIKLDRNNSYKGTLHYEVDFKPAMSLRGGVTFDKPHDLAKTTQDMKARANSVNGGSVNGDHTGSRVSRLEHALLRNESKRSTKAPDTPGNFTPSLPASTSIPGEKPVEGTPAKAPLQSLETPPATATSKAGGEATAAEDPKQGVEIEHDELFSHNSGVLVFQLIDGDLHRKGSIEVAFDDGYWPSFTSTRARSHHQEWDMIGEGFIRDLDFGMVYIRLNAGEDPKKEDIVAEFKIPVKSFLEQTFYSPEEFLLSRLDGSERSTVRFRAKYVPVDITLEPRETKDNMGILRVDVIGAKGLQAADRNGKSDPYAVFNLNGQRAWKTDVKKKTLSPTWNERFEVEVRSRAAADFSFEVMDWDRVGASDFLGKNSIDIASIEPIEDIEQTIPVLLNGKEAGSLAIRLMFTPQIIARQRQRTSTFATAGRVVTTIGGVPIGVGKGVVHGGSAVVGGAAHVVGGAAHGIGAVGGFAGRKIGLVKKKDKSGREVLVSPEEAEHLETDGDLGTPERRGTPRPSTIIGTDSVDGSPSTANISLAQGTSGWSESGILNVTVLNAKDLRSDEGAKCKPFVQLRMGGKSHKTDHVKGLEPEWNESFAFHVSPGTTSFSATVMEHHSFGKDIELGEVDIDITKHLQPPTIQTAEVSAELVKGTGLLRLNLDWTPGGSASTPSKLASSPSFRRTASIHSKKSESPRGFSLKMSRRE